MWRDFSMTLILSSQASVWPTSGWLVREAQEKLTREICDGGCLAILDIEPAGALPLCPALRLPAKRFPEGTYAAR